MFDSGYFEPGDMISRNRDIWQYLDGVAAKSEYLKNDGCARRLLRNLIEVFEESWLENLEGRIAEMESYFESQYPGKQDPEYIQKLKGMCREWEAECLWGYFGWTGEHVSHLRLGFYTGDIFTKDPTLEQDVPPIVKTLEKTNPDIITVAFDPEGSGPDTHYKVLLAVAEALKIHQETTRRDDIQIWGYRNVWYRFGLAEANVYVPVSLNMFAIMHDAFMNSFNSQRAASFPSYEYDGPFSELAQKIQVRQYQKIKICLGREWFNEHPSALIRATRGMVLLQEMTPEKFFQSCRDLQKSIES
jgi:glucosamine-6-phosphate deaminase